MSLDFFLFYIFGFFKDIYSEYARPLSSVFESYIFPFKSFKFFVLSIYFPQPSQMFLFVLDCTKQSLFTFLLFLMWLYFLWWIYISLPFILWIVPAQLSWFSVAFSFSPWNSVTLFLVLNSLRTFKIVDLLTRNCNIMSDLWHSDIDFYLQRTPTLLDLIWILY